MITPRNPAGGRDRALRVRDVMTADVVTVSPETSLAEVLQILAAEHVGGVPVVAGVAVVGVVSAADLLELEASAAAGEDDESGSPLDPWDFAPEPPEGEEAPARFFLEGWQGAEDDLSARLAQARAVGWRLDVRTASDVMTRRLCTTQPGASVRQAARAMIDHCVHRLLVMEGGALVGVVTTTDVVRAIADGRI
jgi:CBS domain-containing protein